MTETARALARRLIRNWNDVPLTREERQRIGSSLDCWEGEP
jgi:hypothetical protein